MHNSEPKEAFFAYCKGKPVQLFLNSTSHLGIVAEVSNARIVLQPYLVEDAFDGHYKEMDAPLVLRTEDVMTPKIITPDDYRAAQRRHPWTEHEGSLVHLCTKSSKDFFGRLKYVSRNFVRLQPFLQQQIDGTSKEIDAGLELLLGDVLAPVPITDEIYRFVINGKGKEEKKEEKKE